MKKWILALLLFVCLCTGGCGTESVRTDDYEYLIGVSLTNVMEPWLNNLAQVIGSRAETEKNVNLIFRDAAGSTEKQIQDIESLMKCGIDLLIVSPDGSNALNGIMEEVFEEIPIVVVGVEPQTKAYTTVIQADDNGIGKMAGEYILENFYTEGDKIIVFQGVEGSPISEDRIRGFTEAVKKKVKEKDIVYYYGDWFRDVAEARMKDYLVVNGAPDIVFAFNDEMAYGAYIAGEQLRMGNGTKFVGVDGFEGESAGLNLVEKEILDATIQSPAFGSLAYDAAMDILEEKEVQRDITVTPRMITGDKK